MAIVTRTKTYAVCPACEKDAGAIDHLLGQILSTRWYCQSCGQSYSLTFSADGTVEISLAVGRKVTTVDVLVLKPQEKPVYFVVDGMRFEGEGHDDREENDHKQFYYEEHSCPTNWFKPTMMYFDGDDDPHGVIEYVATRDDSDFPEDQAYGPNDRDRAVVEFILNSASSSTRSINRVI